MLRIKSPAKSNRLGAAGAGAHSSRSSSSTVSCRLQAAGRRVCRKYRQASIRRMQQLEYDRLRRIVPSLARITKRRRHVSKVTIIEETIRYIDQLHRTLAGRMQSKTGNQVTVTTEQAANDAHQLFVDCVTASVSGRRLSSPTSTGNDTTSGNVAVSVCEKERRLPTYVVRAKALSSSSSSSPLR